jgi:hypothetical protein
VAVGDIQTSFAGGELSPQLYARVDLDKFQVGAALLRNFFVDYRGGVSNRAGTEFIAAVQPNSRLIPFVVSTSAAYVLVFSEELITIFNAGVLVTIVATPYAMADLFQIAYTQSADVLTLVHPNYPPADLSRTSDTTFSYVPIVTGPDISPPVITTMTAPHSGPYSFGYLVTAVDLNGKEESLPSNPGVKHSEAMNETTNRVIELTWTPPAQGVSKYNVYKWGPIDAVTMNPATVWGFIGTSQTTTFSDNNIAPDFSKQPPNAGDPFSGGQFEFINVSAPGSGYDGVSGDWPTAVPFVPLTIVGDGTGASGFAVIDHALGTIVGVFLTNAGKNYTTATITANGQGGTGATFTFAFTDPQPLYPGATAYLQQRRAFGGSTLKPETFALSQPGLINNFNTTPVTLATDAVVESIAAEEVNTIKSFVQVNYGLITFTTGGSFLISGGSPGAVIDANTLSVQPQVSQGANSLRPLRINYDVVYGQAKGNRIHNLAFAWQKQSYTGTDISTLAAHLFDTFLTIDWAYAEEPFKIVWAVRNDGRLLSLTYVPDQDVQAWTRHDTQGLFKSVCSVPEGNVDAVYFLVERYIPSNNPDPTQPLGGWFWYLERMAERQGCCIFDAWFLDCALSYITPVQDQTLFLSASTGAVNLTTSTSDDGARFPNFAQIRNFNSSAIDPIAGSRCSVDWDNGILFTYSAFNNELMSFNTTTAAVILAPTASTAFGIGLTVGEDHHLYGVKAAGNCATLSKVNSATGAVISTFGVTSSSFASSVNTWALPYDFDTMEYQGNVYLISSAEASPINEITVLNCTTMQWMGANGTPDQHFGSVTKGEEGTPHAYVMACAGPTQHMSLYDVLVNLPSYNLNAHISAVAIDPTWTHITNCNGLIFDQTDNTILAFPTSTPLSGWNSGITYLINEFANDAGRDYISLVGGNIGNVPAASPLFWKDIGATLSSNQAKIAKINPNNGAVIWTIAIAGVAQGSRQNDSVVAKGQYFLADNGSGSIIRQIDTIAGTETIITLAGLGFGSQFCNDATGELLVGANYIAGAPPAPVPFGGGASSFAGQFAQFGPAPAAPSTGAFTAPGQVIQIGCGKIILDTVTNTFTATGTVLDALDIDIPDDPDSTPFFIAPGDWTLTTPVAELSGLSHLEGKKVTALADGVVINGLVVTGGAVILPTPATNIVVGLSFTSQIQTLYLTTQGIQEGSDQGKRKQISGVTLRVDCTAGILAGTDFGEYLTLVPETENALDGTLFTGDARVLSYPQWDERGFTMVQQNDPLPASILGIVVEVTPGDTGS